MQGFQGILPAVVTPFDDQERFHAGTFERLLQRMYNAEVDGVYVCGQTGEGMQQSSEQRKRVTEVAVKCSPPGKTVIVHVGAHSTAEAMQLSRHAHQVGAHAVSSLPPALNYSFEEVRAYYRQLAAASELPLLIYYFPSICPAIRSLDDLSELCAIPNVIGLKFTDSDLFRMSMIRRQGAVVFNGGDEMLVAGLLMGANGGIGSIYNLIPEEFVALYRLAAAGNWEGARQRQHSINEFISVILRFPVHSAVKLLLDWSGLPCGTCIAPRTTFSVVAKDKLRTMVAQTPFKEKFCVSTPQ